MDNINQGTEEWLAWRSKGIGGSDVPIIMGVSPYKTPHQLWEEKTNPTPPKSEDNYIFRIGHEMEPKARALYEIQTGIIAPPCLVKRKDKEWQRASLDGRSASGVTVEIKYTGNGEKWELAGKGMIPDMYYPQVQWQLYITGDHRADYVAYNGEEIRIISIQPDVSYIKRMADQVEKFYKLIENKIPPELSDKDYLIIRDKELQGWGKEYKKYKERSVKAAQMAEEFKSKIMESALIKEHTRCRFSGVKINTVNRKGNVDYKKLLKENLPDIDVDQYRKKSTVYKEIRL